MPAPVEFTQQDIIIQIASGDSISAALTREGKVYTWGTFRDKNGIFGCTPNVRT
jgi:regulator of chromosome condensation